MLIDKGGVKRVTTLSRSQIDRLEAAGDFPKRVRLGQFRNSRVAWLLEEVQKWVVERLAKRSD